MKPSELSTTSTNPIFTLCVVALSVIIGAIGCGGGTAGTSVSKARTTKVISGNLTNQDGEPLADTKIEMVASGDSTTTANDGSFLFLSEVPTNAEMRIVGDQIDTLVTLKDLYDYDSQLNLQLKVDIIDDNQNSSIDVDKFEFAVTSISGAGCEGAFEAPKAFNLIGTTAPLVVVNQIAELSAGTNCTVNVKATTALNSITSFGLYEVPAKYSSLGVQGTPAESLSGSLLRQGEFSELGIGSVSFPFRPTTRSVYYLLEAPFERERSKRVSILINPLF
jgi:hypothetical protein